MNFTHPIHQEMLFALLDNQVEFLLVGGYAVIYHGHVRTTGDMDVWLRPTNENKSRVVQVFKNMGISKNLVFIDLIPSPFSKREGYMEFLEMPIWHSIQMASTILIKWILQVLSYFTLAMNPIGLIF